MADHALRLSVVYEDAGDGWVMARIPQFPAVLTQGATVDEARALVLSALQEYLELYVEEHGAVEELPANAHVEPVELLIREAS